MNFIKNIFRKKEGQIAGYDDFWQWFTAHEQIFATAVKNNDNIEQVFFAPLSSKLGELREGFYFLTGLTTDGQVELVFTPDGIVKNIVFVEELVSSAPSIEGWIFTAMKPSVDIENVGVRIQDYTFEKDNLFFVPISDVNYPDEIDIRIVYNDYNADDSSIIETGVYVFLDNFLGELNAITAIDHLEIIAPEAGLELIPIDKIRDFLIWREKEFIEMYDGTRHHTENDSYAALEATLDNGMPLLAIINSTLMQWEAKASHPWMLNLEIGYNGNHTSGLPDAATSDTLNELEDELMEMLRDHNGYLNLGRETANNSRAIYFACKDFRLPAKVMDIVISKYSSKLELSYEIFKDKYWRSLERFYPHV